MKLFVDTANVKEIEALAALGILDGVTTNPSLLAKESGDYRQILKEMCQVVQGPVSAEVVARDATSPRLTSTSSSRCHLRETACGRARRLRPKGSASTSR